jgi:hypothetical protein
MHTHHSHRLFGAASGVSRSTRARRVAALAMGVCLTATLAVTQHDAGAQAAVAAPTCQGQVATIVGTNMADVLIGTPQRDVIVGLAGNDTIRGLGGDDIECGNGGDDLLYGGPGADELNGGPHIEGDGCDLGLGGLTRINCEF